LFLSVSAELAGGVGFGGADVGFDMVVSGAAALAPLEGTKAEALPLLDSCEATMIGGTDTTSSEETGVLDALSAACLASTPTLFIITRATAPMLTKAVTARVRYLLVFGLILFI